MDVFLSHLLSLPLIHECSDLRCKFGIFLIRTAITALCKSKKCLSLRYKVAMNVILPGTCLGNVCRSNTLLFCIGGHNAFYQVILSPTVRSFNGISSLLQLIGKDCY